MSPAAEPGSHQRSRCRHPSTAVFEPPSPAIRETPRRVGPSDRPQGPPRPVVVRESRLARPLAAMGWAPATLVPPGRPGPHEEQPCVPAVPSARRDSLERQRTSDWSWQHCSLDDSILYVITTSRGRLKPSKCRFDGRK